MSPPYPVYMPSPAFPYLPPQMLYMPPMQGGPHTPSHDNVTTGSMPSVQSYPNMENAVTTPVTSPNIATLQTKPHRVASVSFAEKMNSNMVTAPSRVTAEANIPNNIPASTTRSPSPDDNTKSSLSTSLSPRLQESSGSREQNRQISLLLAELDAAKELNVKLQSKLVTTERELESLKITCKLRDAEAETLATSKAAALVEEIYTAQKTHDEAMIGRMRTANEDRDEALLKLSQMDVHSDGYESGSDDYHGDKDIHRLLHQIDTADSSTKVIQHGDRIVDTINKKNQWKHRVVTEEMKAVLEERDVAVLKNRKLESELLRLQRQHHGRSSDNCHQDVAQAKLMATQQERDMAIGKMRKCQEELDKIRLYYNLHKSLSQEEHLRDEFNTKLEEVEGELRQREAVVEHARRVNAQLTEQLKTSVAAKMKMADEVSKAMQTQKGAEANNERLERLVNVLRRKINGLGSKSEDY